LDLWGRGAWSTGGGDLVDGEGVGGLCQKNAI
jgi:hypothetical protein